MAMEGTWNFKGAGECTDGPSGEGVIDLVGHAHHRHQRRAVRHHRQQIRGALAVAGRRQATDAGVGGVTAGRCYPGGVLVEVGVAAADLGKHRVGDAGNEREGCEELRGGLHGGRK